MIKYLSLFGLAIALSLAPASASGIEGEAPAAVKPRPSSVATQAQRTRLILLGTAAGPLPRLTRSQPANVLVVDSIPYVIDAGDGVSSQLLKAGVEPWRVANIFITHEHLDHTAGLAPLIAFRWPHANAPRAEVYGPPGTAELVRDALQYVSIPLTIHIAHQEHPRSIESLATGHDVDINGMQVIYQDARVKVTAVENNHFDVIKNKNAFFGKMKSYSYRFDTPDRSIVFTGDTSYSENVVKLAKNADVLVSEIADVENIVAGFKKMGADYPNLAHDLNMLHSTPDEVGKLATAANVKTVILTHYGTLNDSEIPELKQKVEQYYKGNVISGYDLMKY